jgi:DNA recombination protein RmuC
MESWVSLVILVGGFAAGTAVSWALLRASVMRLRTGLQAAQGAESTRSAELSEACREVESWRSKHQAEQLERARFETEALRVPGVEGELQQARTRIETLGNDKSALQTQLQEQAQSHQEKIAMLTEVRGEIEKDLRNITADALRSNQGTFLQLANEVFERHKSGAEAQLEARQKAVQTLVFSIARISMNYRT